MMLPFYINTMWRIDISLYGQFVIFLYDVDSFMVHDWGNSLKKSLFQTSHYSVEFDGRAGSAFNPYTICYLIWFVVEWTHLTIWRKPVSCGTINMSLFNVSAISDLFVAYDMWQLSDDPGTQVPFSAYHECICWMNDYDNSTHIHVSLRTMSVPIKIHYNIE